jgi:FlaA1/EpsC-like NDP-sugar epimerase
MEASSSIVEAAKLALKGRNRADRKRSVAAKLTLPKAAQFAVDLAILAQAFGLAYLLRFDFSIPHKDLIDGLIQLPLVVLVQVLALGLTGIYAFIWRYIGIAELAVFCRAAIWSSFPIALLRFGLPDQLAQFRVPFSIVFIDGILAFGLILGLRVVRRALYERSERRQTESRLLERKKAVLLIGASHAGVATAREILSRGDSNMAIKGFVDDDPAKTGATIQGIRILGATEDLPRLVREYGIDQAVITLTRASGQQLRRIVDICESARVRVQIIPDLFEVLRGRVKLTLLRDIQAEDLLGREPVSLDEEKIRRFLTGKRIMVTGAGGSIGSELSRQVARFNPASLLLLERAESALFNIDRELREAWPQLCVVPLLADVSNDTRIRAIFSSHRPQVVLHAAAHKHVPMMELMPIEAVKNNIFGTYTIAKIAGEYGVEAFVLISTDKAVRPTSIMGASKRAAELVTQYLSRSHGTRYVAVRFGNVIGSTGSVITIFRDQIRKGGPLTVTHPKMMRYFMTIPEAAQMVLQAGSMGDGGEIFVLDMGKPVNILELAKDVITLSGFKPYEDIDIQFTGIRPGEKLVEDLGVLEERMTATRHPKIFIGNIASYPEETLIWFLIRLAILIKQGNDEGLRRILGELLPEARLANATNLGFPVADASRETGPARLAEHFVPAPDEGVLARL